MYILKNQIIDKIISLLSPLRQTYPVEINTITNDLINDKYNSLYEFVNNHYPNLEISNEIKNIIKELTKLNLIDDKYNNFISDEISFSFIPFIESNTLLIKSRPLNVKSNVLYNIINNTPTPKIKVVNKHEYTEIKYNDTYYSNTNISSNIIDKENNLNSIIPNNNISEENKLNNIVFENNINKENQLQIQETKEKKDTLKTEQIETDVINLRKKIMDAQLYYISNANQFIKSLETKNENAIYNDLIDLNDIRFIQHSLSKLSPRTLERLLPFVEDKLNNNKHSSIDMFIIDVIKKYLHTKKMR